MLQGKVNDISVIQSFWDKNTEVMVSDTLNTVKKINIPLREKPEVDENEEYSRQDVVHTDMNFRDD